jgi:hypothetical protein
MSEKMIYIHDITLTKPTDGDVKQEKFVDFFNEVSELWKKSQDPNLSEEERKEYLEQYSSSKYCLEQGIGY